MEPVSASPARRFWHLAALVLLPLLAYVNSLNNGLFLDDLNYIVNNAYIRDWHYLPRLFTEPLTAGAGKATDYYRPAILGMYTLGYSLWDLNPMGYHLFSLLFHIGCVLLLWILLSKLMKGSPVPFLTALLFSVHPVQTEAVNSASALGIQMGAFFGFLALLAHLKSRPESGESAARRMGFLGLGAVSMVVALLSKETMVVLPGLVFLMEYCFLRDDARPLERLRRSLWRSLPYLVVALSYIALRFTILNFGGTGNLFREENVFTQSMSARFYTFLTVLTQFIRLMVWPKTLFMERSTVMPVYIGFWQWPVVVGFTLFAAMIVISLWGMWRIRTPLSNGDEPGWARVVPFSILWFLFGLVPVSNVFIPISTTIVESWLYMPMIGPAFGFFYVLWKLFRPWRDWRVAQGLACVFLATMLTVCMVKTVRQNRVWRDPVSFYEHNLRYAPGSARFRNNLAMAYADQKRHQEAVDQYLLAIRTSDEYPETRHNLANTYQAMGKLSEAEVEYRRAIAMDKTFFHSYLALANLYLSVKQGAAAESVMLLLVQNAPQRWEGYYNLGVLHLSRNDRKGAAEWWNAGLKVDPYNRALRRALDELR